MFTLYLFIFGCFIGSFLNVLADRLPRGEDVIGGRSHCDFCKKTLRWYELIPVLSFVRQGGRCLRCHKKLSLQYPITELATGIGFAFLYLFLFTTNLALFLSYYVLFSALLVIFVADLKYQIIPDSMTVLATLAAVFYHYASGDLFALYPTLLLAGLGTCIGFFLLWAATQGRGMGFGDVKFAFFMGVFLGYPGVIFALYGAFLTGGVYGVILLLARKKGLKSKVAFGPFLIVGVVAAWVFHAPLLNIWHMYL